MEQDLPASVTVVTTVTGILERVSIKRKKIIFVAGRSKKMPKFNSDSPEDLLQRLQRLQNWGG
jgi:hypothetical protein